MAHHKYGHIHTAKFAFSFSLIWALGVLLVAWLAAAFDYGQAFIDVWSSVYIGYGASFLGGIIGAIWGFIDFFIFIGLSVLVYNLILGHETSERPTEGRPE